MFSGLVQETGKVIKVEKNPGKVVLYIQGKEAYNNIVVNDSIAVNGCCLTVTSVLVNNIATFDVLPETLRKTNLGDLTDSSTINLEKSLTLQDKIGGHMVQGHIDTTAKIIEQYIDGDSVVNKFEINPEFAQMIVPKAFIAIDGISLTVVECANDWFSVMIIPHTNSITISKNWKIGSIVNIEIDIINKSIWSYMQKLQHKNN
ncbi:riboflavin synthase [Rickettsiales bacterium LUAb2]